MRLLENIDYFIYQVPFPVSCADGMVTPNDDGTFTIYLDANATDAKKKKALAHELRHIEREHFYSDAPIREMEDEADCSLG